MRIIAEKIEYGQWCAWIEGNAGSAFTGETATQATERLIATLHGVDVNSVALDNQRSRIDRYVFVIGRACPDCGGSGTYTGLVETSDCATCHGAGRVADDGLPPVPF